MKQNKYLNCIWCGIKPPLSAKAMYCSAKCKNEAMGKNNKTTK